MAEVVEYRIESTVHELEQLERFGLMTNQEVKAVIKRRKAFEYKLQRNTRTKEDYLKYIAYEESLLKLIRVRRDKLGIKSNPTEIEATVIRHMDALFRKIVFKNQLDVQLWLSYIDFAKSHRSLAKTSSLYSRMLAVLSNKDSLWIKAAKFEFEDYNSPDTARALLQRGIRFNPSSQQLWYQYFKMELMYCTKIRKRREVLANHITAEESDREMIEQSKDDVFNGKIATIVYQNAIIAFDDFTFAAGFLPICSEFDHKLTETHKNVIYDDLKFRFSSHEELYDLLAKRVVEDGNDWIKSSPHLTKQEKKTKKKEFERKAIGIYEQSIDKLNNQKMWSFYITYRLDQLSKCATDKKIRSQLAKVLDLVNRAWTAHCLSPDLFQEQVRLYFSCNDKYDNKLQIKQILVNGCERWTDSLDVWHFCIPFFVKIVDSKHEIKNFFERILNKFSEINDKTIEKLTEVWEQYIEWSAKYLLPAEVLNITKKLPKMASDANTRQLIEHMRPRILDALNSAYGLEKSRHYYHSMIKCPPNAIGFHQKMLDIETNNQNRNIHMIRNIHERIVTDFGAKSAALWMDYIQFEMQCEASKVSNIYYRAVKCLTPEECDRFIESYTIFKSNSISDDMISE